MRKNPVILSLAIIVIGVVCCVFIYDSAYYYKQTCSGVFCADDYKTWIDDFEEYVVYDPLPLDIGYISDSKAAKEKAELYWAEHCGEDVKEQKPYYCFWDDDAKVWHITTKKAFKHIWERRRMGGGAAHLIVSSDGKVLAVWRDK